VHVKTSSTDPKRKTMSDAANPNEEMTGQSSVTDLFTDRARRRFLSGMTVVGVVGLASCTGSDDKSSSETQVEDTRAFSTFTAILDGVLLLLTRKRD